jgi:hypothetical protein
MRRIQLAESMRIEAEMAQRAARALAERKRRGG